MDKMQRPHPTHGSTHVCSFSPPSASELSPQYLASPHHSSQALLWNNYKNPPQDSIQATLWSPQWTEPQIPSSPPDFWSTLQLNHTSADNPPLAASSVVSVDSPDNAALAVHSALLLSGGGRTVKPGSFPLSVVSGPRPIPFACKLDMAAVKSREVSFAKISAYNKDLERNSRVKDGVPASVKVEMDDSPKLASQGNGSSLHSVREREREEGGSESMEMLVQKDMQNLGDEFGGTIASSLGDSTIDLKLGKRTFLEHSSAEVGGEGNHRAAVASIANNPKRNNNGNSNGGTIKRHKALSPTVNIPRCQAEDCNADLSDAKGYHRRHKVCEWHSKSSKVKVASIEQRFCQQCSRFHVLSEFDEGKRSCRRRLAGHNERRRKQQPEPMSLLSAAHYAHFADGKHLLSTSLLDHFYFLQHKRASMFSCLDSAALTGHPGVAGADDLQELKLQHHPKQEPVANLPAAELHHFMRGSRGRDGNLVGGGAQALIVANDHDLEQSNPGGPSTSAACLIPLPQPPPEISVSRRALSLLSSSLGSPNNSCSMSTSLGVSLPSIEGLLTENHTATSSCLTMSSSSSCFISNSGKGMEIMPLLHSHGITTLASPDNGAVIHSSCMDHVQPSTIPNFDGSSMFLMVPENCFQGGRTSQHSRLVQDLMQVSTSEPQQQQQQVEIQFTDLEGLSMFGRHRMI